MVSAPYTVDLWTYRRIPYTFESSYPYEEEVRAAMTQWERAAGVSFQRRVQEVNYLVVKNPHGGSNSHIGMQGGPQEVNITAGYKSLHELGHALGLIHEQNRSDRDAHVDVQWSNIEDGKSNRNFERDDKSQNLSSYDLKSVMHYPAPAKGWGGIPQDREVWTMRWRADHSVKLGAGPHQGWSTLSGLDSGPGLRRLYERVPVPMGEETAHDTWNNPYASQFPFEVGGRQFFCGQNRKNNYWFIQELLPGGKMGRETDHGTWKFFYGVQFAFSVAGRVFLYGQNMNERNWFVQELLPEGKMGKETDHGTWKFAYASQGSFSVDGRVFLYGQNMNERNWFVQELLPEGKMGKETDHGTWNFAYASQGSFSVDGRVFLYGQNQKEKNWFIQELLPEGKLGSETAHGTWNKAYATQFFYYLKDQLYFYGQNLSSGYWFIQRINPDGTMGDEIQSGFWHYSYPVQFPFQIGADQYFYGQNTDGLNWFIQELVDV